MKPDTARVFAAAEDGAKKAGDAFVTTERLLIAIAKEGGEAAKILEGRRGHGPGPGRPPPRPSARAAPPTAPRPRKATTR